MSENHRPLRVLRSVDDVVQRSKYQWRLTSLILLTTLVAIASAGFGRQGFSGALGAVVLSWLGLFGLFLVVNSVQSFPKKLLKGCWGSGLLGFAMYSWWELAHAPREFSNNAWPEFVIDFRSPWPWFKLLAGLAVCYAVWRVLRPRWIPSMIVDASGVSFFEGVPQPQRNAVREFFERDLVLDSRVEIRAERFPNGRLRVDFRGELSTEVQQRIRNFLNTVV